MDLDLIGLQTLDKTWDLHQLLYRILEKNIEVVKEQTKGKPYDPWYFSHSVRYLTCCDLDSSNKTDIEFERHPQPLSAIDLHYHDYHVKVWKTTDGELPITGTSTKRCGFVSQLYLTDYFESFASDVEIPMNLAFLWEVDSSLSLASLQLVCPKSFENFWKSGDTFFNRAVPHPAAQVKSTTAFTEEVSELDIVLDRKKAANNGERES